MKRLKKTATQTAKYVSVGERIILAALALSVILALINALIANQFDKWAIFILDLCVFWLSALLTHSRAILNETLDNIFELGGPENVRKKKPTKIEITLE